ncbi:hypothetical protein TSUD_60440 [Trifolium subterraneum]|uniref:Uncharacterized protein n=1 Tax=Trifolium subterraneum TaxID=3900 RepID=A0A2Z6PA10_TRISU|nr:hypothetical protein TSUD_60440 [Trifolium subterraneum]
MVEKHTTVLEAIGRGESDDMRSFRLQIGRSVGNPPRYRKKGGAVASSSHIGHNRTSCRFRAESNAESQTHSENNSNYVDNEFFEDNNDWNLSMVTMRPRSV